MNRRITVIALGCAAMLLGLMPVVDAAPTIDQLNNMMDSLRIVEADVFAPKTYEKAVRRAAESKKAITQGKKQKIRDKYIEEAFEFAENALRATEVAKLSLNEYLPPRDKARKAKANLLVQVLYQKAEVQFIKATAKVEKGDVKNGLKEAEKSKTLFNTAELEGIRVDILGGADKLIAAAVADGAGKFALSTLDKARGARTKGNAIISQDRYNRKEATVEAKRAEYEARHASNIAQSVRSLNRNDQAWEKLMLVYEIQIDRIGNEVGAGRLPFDNGPIAAADSLIMYIQSLADENNRLIETQEVLAASLGKTLERLEYKNTDNSPVELAAMVDREVESLQSQVSSLTSQVEQEVAKSTELESSQEGLAAELQIRKDQENKFRKAKSMFNPSEGEVLFNSSNDIVLRLSGISFDVGKSSIKDEHIPMLEKVVKTIGMFPDSKLIVEGHTDATGDANTNTFLSEKRAFAVMQYLRQSMLIPADQIRSIGYGDEKPVASNSNAEGRAKNRRIDIIILR